ncbi:hypothetical protein ScPMuIL_010891 [Solemya velum]
MNYWILVVLVCISTTQCFMDTNGGSGRNPTCRDKFNRCLDNAKRSVLKRLCFAKYLQCGTGADDIRSIIQKVIDARRVDRKLP